MIRVLLVDDEQVELEAISNLLAAEGDISVDIALSGEAALKKLATAHFDAVISDYLSPPAMNGIDLLRNARARGFVNTFLLFTDRGNEEVALDAILNGADHFLPRSSRPTQDIALIRSVLLKRQKHIEEEHESRTASAYHAILMHMQDGFAYHQIIQDEIGRPVSSMIIDANPAFESLFSTGDPVLGRDVRHLIEKRDEFDTRLLQAFNDYVVKGGEVRFTERSKVRDRWFSVSILPAEPGHFTTVLTDISAVKRLEEMEARYVKKIQFLGAVTRHDLTNQLTVNNGYINVSLLKAGDSPIKESLNKAAASADKMRRILEFSRDYDRMGAKPPAWIRVQDAAGKGIERLKKGGPKIVIELVGLETFADPTLETVFFHLADNAIRHGHATEIRFFFMQAGEDLRIVCQDNGTGVGQEKRTAGMFDDRFSHGLLLIKEILAVTGLSIEEIPTENGARFEILVPKNAYRFL